MRLLTDEVSLLTFIFRTA